MKNKKLIDKVLELTGRRIDEDKIQPVLTQSQKDNWLTALKSGYFVQGFGMWSEPIARKGGRVQALCCLEVCALVTSQATNTGPGYDYRDLALKVGRTVDNEGASMLVVVNDGPTKDVEKRDYANVIPIIELLPTID